MFKSSIQRLRLLGFLEGITLLLLIAVGVPLKHIFHQPTFVSILGPIHGAIFLVYLLNTWESGSKGNWSGKEIARTMVLSLVPCGTFFNDSFLKSKEDIKTNS